MVFGFLRRTFIEQVLHIIKDEGSFNTMHTLLVYLQNALQDQCPVVAGLLLQLDLLVSLSVSLFVCVVQSIKETENLVHLKILSYSCMIVNCTKC